MSLPLVAWAGLADAQVASQSLTTPVRPNLPSFRIFEDPRQPGQPARDGLIAAYPVRGNLTVGVGRFALPAVNRPRAHAGTDGQAMSVRRRERGMAAVGFSLLF